MVVTWLKRIGIDARMYGLEHAGIGRYVMNLVDRLLKSDELVQWVIFCAPAYETHFRSIPNIDVITTSIPHYSLKEQTQWVALLNQAKLDLLHVPHFNVPLWYSRPFVVTIHDILWHHVQGGSVTTLKPWVYFLKYQGYRMVVNQALVKAKKIFTPSQFVKDDLLATFPAITADKIAITYEGAPTKGDETTRRRDDELKVRQNLLYVGSAYPHKNIPIIFKAMELVPTLKLVIVGSRSVFLDRLQQELHHSPVMDRVIFAGRKTDAELQELYQSALCLIHPSKSEGFGLTGLEAMSAGCPVIAANASCLPEIYGNAALYFNPDSREELAAAIKEISGNRKLRQQLIANGYRQVNHYSWDSMVKQTLSEYKKALT